MFDSAWNLLLKYHRLPNVEHQLHARRRAGCPAARVTPQRVSCMRLLGATPIPQDPMDSVDMMEHMVRLHLDHKPHWNSLDLPVSRT
jgi:hypothetical protein